MKDYIRTFLEEDEGIETIEFLGMVIVAVALVTVIVTIGNKISKQANGDGGAGGAVEELDSSKINQAIGVPGGMSGVGN